MPDPTARMTRKPRVSALAIAALIAAVVVACAAVYFFAMESKEWIPFAGLMCFAVALLIYGVVELAAHSRDVRRWREYEVAYDEVTDPEGSWWGDDSDNEVSDKDERLSTYSFGGDDENAGSDKVDEPADAADEDDGHDHKDTTKAPIAAESYTPLDVLVAKRASKGNTQTPSTRDTMPGAGKNSIPPVGGSGSMPTPGAVTIPHVDETASADSSEVDTAKEVDVDTSVDSDTAATTVADKDEPDLSGEDDKHTAEDTETHVDTAETKEEDEDTATERVNKSIAAVDFITGEFTYANSPVVDDDKDTETRADNPAVDDKDSTTAAKGTEDTAEDIAEDTETRVDNPAVKDEDNEPVLVVDFNGGATFDPLADGKDTGDTEDTETRVDNPTVEDKDTAAAAAAEDTETRVDNPAVTDEDEKTDAATKPSKGGFNLLGFGKQDKE